MNVGLIGHESTDDPQFERMTAGGDVTTEELLIACEEEEGIGRDWINNRGPMTAEGRFVAKRKRKLI